MLLIDTPEEIERPLFWDKLILGPDTTDDLTKSDAEKLTRRQLGQLDIPTVTLGYPEWWNLSALIREKGESLPAELALQRRDAEFYLVRCACSFRPSHRSEVEWARLSVALEALQGELQPIAFDIYPREVFREAQNDIKINIAPSLKFFEVELKPGEVVGTVHFTKLEPIIVGTGVQEANVCWDFEKYGKQGVRGAKFLYMIIKRPFSTPSVQICLDVVAKVKTDHGLFPATIGGVRDRRVQSICT